MIESVQRFVQQCGRRPWLVLGKGPTLSRYTAEHLAAFNVLSLNHACINRSPTLAHFTDIEAFRDCCGYLSTMSVAVVLPWHPHVKFSPGQASLAAWAAKEPVLKSKEASSLLFSYNSTLAAKLPVNVSLPRVRVRAFSAVAAFNLLGVCGVRNIATLGVDGGTEYAADQNTATRLANGQKSFDAQRQWLDEAVRRYKLNWSKL